MFAGYGIKLRQKYYDDLYKRESGVDWLEVLSENYINSSAYDLYHLQKLNEMYSITMHGVSMSLGGIDDIDYLYLDEIKKLINILNPPVVSDHVCVTKINGIYTHELLPLPYTEESLKNIVSRVKIVQDYIGRQIAIENVSSYITYPNSHMLEEEFISLICKQADCHLLLDINNVYVSACNHKFSAKQYLTSIPLDRVVQLHIAGHTNNNDILLDTHDQPVCDEVWSLYRDFCRLKPDVPMLLERDENLPEFDDLLNEICIARDIHDSAL